MVWNRSLARLGAVSRQRKGTRHQARMILCRDGHKSLQVTCNEKQIVQPMASLSQF
jgi:hypothetical protein